ncbi:hypothetical protein BDQ17DRAFT_1249555 [Cyathus striatus]|nr:hypothetical protein BDQ17DRAFT_1249555 [Cyathus striatus]
MQTALVKKPPRKKQKSNAQQEQDQQLIKNENSAKRVCKGNRGILKQLLEMPLDVLYEIFGMLDPLDLVQLTRTTKAIRKMLASNSALWVWIHSRSNVNRLPECPNDMTEWAYAALMFEKHCIGCG